MRVCARCIYDERVAGIAFDAQGICNYCDQIEKLKDLYGTGSTKGASKLESVLQRVRDSGRGKKYDCIVGVSGGTDSSFLLHWCTKQGLRPLAVHYDNTWNGSIASSNIRLMVESLGVDLYTYVVDNEEADDIFRAFFLAGVPELEASTDLAYAYVLRKVARTERVPFIFEGHSFVEEGVTPLGRNYFDGRYIREIHRLFGTRRMNSYPLMTLWRFLYAAIAIRVEFIRPLWFINYSKAGARDLLKERYGWMDYGGHHLENRMTAFMHSVYLPKKFGVDFRNNTISARVRNGEISRNQGLEEYATPVQVDPGLENFFCQRLGFDLHRYREILASPPRNWEEFPTYKKVFELLRPVFRVLADRELVTRSFYLKYCFPQEGE